MKETIFSIQGIDPEDFTWQDLAVCTKFDMDINDFFEGYTKSPIKSQQIDEMCMACPVAAVCAQQAIDGKEYGVWGGVYWSSGNVDKDANRHKTPQTWGILREKIGLV